MKLGSLVIDHYQILGTYNVLDATPMASGTPRGAQIHYTHALPGTAEYYRKTGKFPVESLTSEPSPALTG